MERPLLAAAALGVVSIAGSLALTSAPPFEAEYLTVPAELRALPAASYAASPATAGVLAIRLGSRDGSAPAHGKLLHLTSRAPLAAGAGRVQPAAAPVHEPILPSVLWAQPDGAPRVGLTAS